MIAVFGGTFDPIHFGHLRPLWEVKQALGLDEIRLIPCFIPPHRDAPGATVEQRLAMLQLALKDVPGFVIDERELQRGGPSYMVDTLQSLRDELGQAPICLIMGLDAFLGIERWYQWQRLHELAHVIVTQRPGSELPDEGPVAELINETRVQRLSELFAQVAGKTYFQSVTQLDISATAIREQIARGQDVRFLMPNNVRRFIETEGLYTTERAK